MFHYFLSKKKSTNKSGSLSRTGEGCVCVRGGGRPLYGGHPQKLPLFLRRPLPISLQSLYCALIVSCGRNLLFLNHSELKTIMRMEFPFLDKAHDDLQYIFLISKTFWKIINKYDLIICSNSLLRRFKIKGKF